MFQASQLMLQVLVLIVIELWLILFSVPEIQFDLLSIKPIRLQETEALQLSY